MKRIMLQPKHFRFGLAWVGKPFSITYSQLPDHNVEASSYVIADVWRGLALSAHINQAHHQPVRTNVLDTLDGAGDNYADYIKAFLDT